MAPEAAPPDPEQRRLFVAVPLPASVTKAIDAAIGPWRMRFPRARWVRPQDRHLTLKFLGPTPARLDDWLHDRLREVAASTRAFEIHLAGLGAFPSSDRAKVLWIGLEAGSGRLATLAETLEAVLAPEFAPERRPFAPHVTVARSDLALEVPDEYPASPLTDSSVPIGEIVLFQSLGGRNTPRYEPLGVFPLSG